MTTRPVALACDSNAGLGACHLSGPLSVGGLFAGNGAIPLAPVAPWVHDAPALVTGAGSAESIISVIAGFIFAAYRSGLEVAR